MNKLAKRAWFAYFLAAAMHNDDLHARGIHERDVGQKRIEVGIALHHAAADLHEHCGSAEILYVRQRLGQDRRLMHRQIQFLHRVPIISHHADGEKA